MAGIQVLETFPVQLLTSMSAVDLVFCAVIIFLAIWMIGQIARAIRNIMLGKNAFAKG